MTAALYVCVCMCNTKLFQRPEAAAAAETYFSHPRMQLYTDTRVDTSALVDVVLLFANQSIHLVEECQKDNA